ncbi:hypothetical protein [Aurantimonas endophytica]|uniref:Uncharacterized protein n=1 Tax=Aurantimonas endophytica TaxID=1522175 RepID=A0A7W6MPS1_9HYPH|nr:hypothetical protein [Aurantimonas endophytica]MBB4003315.1 hypothetical protein [Aurantimonas endophytica]MCO6404176.1 hypothetical protein [Aurantimonas endophytica]
MPRYNMIRMALLAALLAPSPVLAQAFDPGPMGSVPGSSVSGMRIDGAPRPAAGPRVPGADVFGDTVEERVYGKDFDDSYLRPVVPRGSSEANRDSIERRATEGRSDLNDINAGDFARSGPNAIGGSAVTHGRSNGRAIIRR